MMIVRPSAYFEDAFPDDTIWSDNEDIIRPPGKALCEALAELLTDAGFKVEPPEAPSIGYWTIGASMGGADIGIWVYHGLFPESRITVQRYIRLSSLFKKTPSLADYLILIHDKMSADPRFTKIRWFQGRDPEPDGFNPVPVTD